MTHGSLFSGIGGFDLAAEWMGWENIFHCEIEKFPRTVLKYYWPKAISYEDITKTDFTIHRGRIDILTGGFPCQPFSVAGKRKGTDDHRHLWPEMLRAIREIQPVFIVGENVPGIVNWNDGMVFEQVCSDLENEGYKVVPVNIPAAGVNAPHKRERIWFIAYASSHGYCYESSKIGCQKRQTKAEEQREKWYKVFGKRSGGNIERAVIKGSASNTPDSRTEGLQRKGENGIYESEPSPNAYSKKLQVTTRGEFRILSAEKNAFKRGQFGGTFTEIAGWEDFPTQSPICHGNDGLPTRLDGITFPKWRKESLKAGGNAIVPQVALQIFKAIEKVIQSELLKK